MGTTVKTGYIEKILLPYAKAKAQSFLTAHWDDADVKDNVQKMRKKLAHNRGQDPNLPQVADESQPKEAQIQSIVQTFDYILRNPKADTVLHQRIRKLIWKEGFAKKDETIKTPVYSDVVIQLKKWKTEKDVKFFVFSHANSELQSIFMSNTNHGDLEALIDGHCDPTDTGPKNDSQSYIKIAQKAGLQPQEMVFLSKSAQDATAAEKTGMPAVLVLTHRSNIEHLTPEEKTAFKGKIVRSFNEVDFDESGMDLALTLSQMQAQQGGGGGGGPPPGAQPGQQEGGPPPM